MDVRLNLAELRAVGQTHPGFWHDLTAAGEMEGAELRISADLFQELNRKHFGAAGLGNLIHVVAAPVASVLNWATGGALDFSNCGGCAQRQVKANAIG